MKPVVGVMPLWDEEKESLWMLPGYLDGISEAGGLPIVLPLTTNAQDLGQVVEMCDGFLFTGGQDVSPELYGEKPLEGLVECCVMRDSMELYVLEKALRADKPVLGICRGVQLINVALGGTLYQDIPAQWPSEVEHQQKPPYDIPVHDVALCKDTPLYECLKVETLAVNSYHHQAVKDVAEKLQVMAVSPDGLVEAVCMPGHRFLWAVQWHPEFSHEVDAFSRKIFSTFVEAMA